MGRIKVGIVGVGNCASALVQGVYYYKEKGTGEGLIHEDIGGYKVWDIEFVAAVDVGETKVGKDLSEAIFAPPNMVPKFAEVPKLGVTVVRGPVMDGVAPHMVDVFKPVKEDRNPSVDEIADALKEADVVVNLLPVGSEEATRFYAEAALRARAAFVNGIPVFIASDPKGYWPKRYEEAGLPLLGDDVKGQVGATITHRTLVSLLRDRGLTIEGTYQLNIGGNTDFLNMLMEERLVSKRISKTRAVTSLLKYGERLEKTGGVRIGPSDYVPFLGNTKVAYMYIKARSFAGFPVTIDLKLCVDDKSMCAAVLVDVIRVAKVALDRGEAGAIPEASAWYFKHPPVQAPSDAEARRWLEEWLATGKRIVQAPAQARSASGGQ
ncbi:inositol-3-phosphate synthase [Stetteria hydrogenophila]